MKKIAFIAIVVLLIGAGATAIASGTGADSGTTILQTLLSMVILLMFARLASFVEKVGQPAVLGELIAGVALGNLMLLGVSVFEPIKHNQFIGFLSELGVIFLLFQVGLESNITQMKKVGLRAFLVATVGVVVPFVLGTYVVGPWLFPGIGSNAYLFLGAALTATSVGITARVFKDLQKLHTPEAQIVLGAAVIDDIMGLILLAIVSAIATVGAVSVGAVSVIFLKAVVFLLSAVLLGQFLARFLGSLLSKIHTGIGMKFTLAICFALAFSYVAGFIGLAPIVGAFAAGLILDPVHFKHFRKPKIAYELAEGSRDMIPVQQKHLSKIAEHHSQKHVEDLVEPISLFLVPIFFVMTGMQVNLQTLFNPSILLVAVGITLVAIFGKYVAGLAAGPRVDKNIVGFGMVPRGEVGLIFASIGSSLGVINQEIFSIIVIMVILTTLLTPPVLTYLLNRRQQRMPEKSIHATA